MYEDRGWEQVECRCETCNTYDLRGMWKCECEALNISKNATCWRCNKPKVKNYNDSMEKNELAIIK